MTSCRQARSAIVIRHQDTDEFIYLRRSRIVVYDHSRLVGQHGLIEIKRDDEVLDRRRHRGGRDGGVTAEVEEGAR